MAILPIRDLTTIEDCQSVVKLQRDVWGFTDEDVVPAAMLILAIKRGGILAAAFDDDVMAGFVYSLPGLREGRVVQWSHMLGVAKPYRRTGIGRDLKLVQRDRTIAMGLDLIEWTFDPLQVVNASLNIHRLGATVSVYMENLYGTSSSPLHSGTPTDRFVAEWWILTDRVRRRLSGEWNEAAGTIAGPVVNQLRADGCWLACGDFDLHAGDPRVFVGIPATFGDMQREAPALALDWRLKTRAGFTSYFGRGYRVVDFIAQGDRGFYCLARGEEELA